MPCQFAQSRDETVDAYILNELTSNQRDEFDAHLYTCDVCFEAVQHRQALATAVRRQNARVTKAKSRSLHTTLVLFLRKTAYIVVAAIALFFFGRLAYRVLLPPHYESAKLSAADQEILQRNKDSGQMINKKHFTVGLRALRAAESERFLAVPVFDHTQIDTAIFHFRQFYSSAETPLHQTAAAYFLGKTFLMRDQTDSACFWFDRALAQKEGYYHERAREIKRTLGRCP